jgi:orotidine-5'-phosphate decarboxylase
MVEMKKIMVALDDMDEPQAIGFLERWPKDSLPTIKIGLEMYYRFGPSFVREIYNRFGVDIFLDLKLHDIPNTVSKSIRSLKGLPIKFLTIHLSGGEKMIASALSEARVSLPDTKILGVSFLTSLGENDLKELFGITPNEIKLGFERLFNIAYKSKIDGVVLSAKELEWFNHLQSNYSHIPLKVTPGIRFSDEIASGEISDQVRVETPESAFKKGADYLVLGRSLTKTAMLDGRIKELRMVLNKRQS